MQMVGILRAIVECTKLSIHHHQQQQQQRVSWLSTKYILILYCTVLVVCKDLYNEIAVHSMSTRGGRRYQRSIPYPIIQQHCCCCSVFSELQSPRKYCTSGKVFRLEKPRNSKLLATVRSCPPTTCCSSHGEPARRIHLLPPPPYSVPLYTNHCALCGRWHKKNREGKT